MNMSGTDTERVLVLFVGCGCAVSAELVGGMSLLNTMDFEAKGLILDENRECGGIILADSRD